MKQLSIILNAVLLVAVAVLFYFHFSKNTHSEGAPISVSPKDIKSSKIVYVNSDSLLTKYELYKKAKTQLEDKNKKAEAELDVKARKFQEEVQAYQQKAMTMTKEQAESTEMGLKKKQEDILKRKEELGTQLAEEEKNQNDVLFSKIQDYLKRYCEKTGYKFVLGYGKGGNVLFANDSFDITKQVIEGLNKEYHELEKK